MALIALVQARRCSGATAKAALIALGMFGASLFYGDGMITPAISVLSAVEGAEGRRAEPRVDGAADHARRARRAVRDPALRHRRGRPALRAGDGASGSPCSAVAGLAQRRPAPGDPRGALAHATGSSSSPTTRRSRSSRSASVVLAVTGAEALYADMGHFGRAADPPRLVLRRLPGADAQLPGPGLADPRATRARSTTRSSC